MRRGEKTKFKISDRQEWESIAASSVHSDSSPTLPYDYTARINRVSQGHLLVPNLFFFRFVPHMDLFFSSAFTAANCLAHGETLILAAKRVLVVCPLARSLAADIIRRNTSIVVGPPAPPPVSDGVLSEFIEFCVHVYSRLRGSDYVKKLLGRKTKKEAGLAVFALRAGVALGSKTYTKMLDKMDAIAENADHVSGEDAESSGEDDAEAGDAEAFLSCNSGDEGYSDDDISDDD